MATYSPTRIRPIKARLLDIVPSAPVWLALAAFTALLAYYGANAADPSWEVGATRWIQSTSPGSLEATAEFMTVMGRSPISTLIPLFAVGVLWALRHRGLAAFLGLAALARVLSVVVKALVDRPRPSAALVDVANQLGDPSFPSGHVLGATLLYGFLIYCAERSITHPLLKRGIQGGLALVIVLMGYARVELGEHWPTDVLGGYAIGLLVLSVVIWMHRRLEARGEQAPHES